jgi:hypothetical protein
MHGCRYRMASAGVAISDSPTGPFTYLRSFRPHGEECRDMTVFKVRGTSIDSNAMGLGLLSDAWTGVRLCAHSIPGAGG